MIGDKEILHQINMISKNTIFFIGILLALVLAFNFVSAERIVNYNVYSAIIEDSGSMNVSLNPVNNFYVEGYACTAVNCTSIASAKVAGLTTYSAGSVVTVTFPTALINSNGYVLYFYKQGYIGWEQRNVKIYGTNNTPVTAPTPIYLSKKRTGFSPITNFSVVNQAYTYQPLQINLDVAIDANTYSALRDSHRTAITLNQSENVNTTVVLQIRDSLNNVVASAVRNILIVPSQYQHVSFVYNFTTIGNYNITLTTNVTDQKILLPLVQQASASVNVINQNSTNYSYSLIQNLLYAPLMPNVNNTVNFSLGVLSNYVDSQGNYTPLNTTVNSTIYRNNVVLGTNLYTVLGTNYQTFNNFNFSTLFNQTGNYTLILTASPQNARGNSILTDTRTLSFVIGNFSSNNTVPSNDTTAPIITNITTDPLMPFVTNGSSRNITINFTSNEYPLTIWFNLYNLTNLVNTQGPMTIQNASGLPVHYVIPAGLPNGLYFLNMTVMDSALNSATYVVGNFTVNRTSGSDDGNDDNGDDNEDNNDNSDTNNANRLSDVSEPLNSNYTIYLAPKNTLEKESWKLFLYWLIIAILAILIIIVLIYIVKFVK